MRLYVNIDHVATVRQARMTDEPDPVRAAVLAELGGADGITIHLREDRRHIQDRDVRVLMETARTVVNLELAATSDILELACSVEPYQATLVPEKREEVTTEGGLAMKGASLESTAAAVARLHDAGIRSALFVDPDEDALRASKELGVHAVELHTGEYANSSGEEQACQLSRLEHASELARTLGLDVHAGHGLTYENVAPVAAIEPLEELNIGHSIVSRAIFTGMESAVRDMAAIIHRARGSK